MTKYYTMVLREGAICGLFAGVLFLLFTGFTSSNLLSLPLGTFYGLSMGLIIGFIIKPPKEKDK